MHEKSIDGIRAASCMMPTQPSPVETRRSVKRALPKFSKFACRFIVSYSLTSEKSETPSTENKNRNRMRSAPTFISSGMARINVLKMCCRFLADLISFRTLAILNDLIIVEMLPTSMLNT